MLESKWILLGSLLNSYLRNILTFISWQPAGGDQASGMGMTFTMDEFFSNSFIVGDLSSLLRKMQEKIKSFDAE